MKSILKELYLGEIRPFEREKYHGVIEQLQEELLKSNYRDREKTIGQYFSLVEKHAFYDGFELGAMLMIEMYTKGNNLSR